MTMTLALKLTAWLFVSLVALYAAIHPEQGVLYDNPLASVGVGLIGLGICMQARRALLA